MSSQRGRPIGLARPAHTAALLRCALPLLLSLLTALSAGEAAAAPRQAGPTGAAACDRLHAAIRFPIGADGLSAPQPPGAFDMRRSDVALTCQVVFVDADDLAALGAAQPPPDALTLPPG